MCARTVILETSQQGGAPPQCRNRHGPFLLVHSRLVVHMAVYLIPSPSPGSPPPRVLPQPGGQVGCCRRARRSLCSCDHHSLFPHHPRRCRHHRDASFPTPTRFPDAGSSPESPAARALAEHERPSAQHGGRCARFHSMSNLGLCSIVLVLTCPRPIRGSSSRLTLRAF